MTDDTAAPEEDPHALSEERLWSRRNPNWYKELVDLSECEPRIQELAMLIDIAAQAFITDRIHAWVEDYKTPRSYIGDLAVVRAPSDAGHQLETDLLQAIADAHNEYPGFFTRSKVMRLTHQSYQQALAQESDVIGDACKDTPFGRAGFEIKYAKALRYYKVGFLGQQEQAAI
ncbi:MAG: hypothetical protein ACOYJ2_05965 [Rickettsiales bacterium]